MHLEFTSALNLSQNLTEIAVRRHLMNDWGFRVVKAIRQNPDVLVCKLVEGKITYMHAVCGLH
jgi:hypothetical protein